MVISGTCKDKPTTAGYFSVGLSTDTAGIEISIQDITRGTTYWAGAGTKWSDNVALSSVACVTVNSGLLEYSTWQYDVSVDWISDHEYRIYVFGTDDIDNESGSGSGYTIYYDTTPPVSKINYPIADAKIGSLSQITGTANGKLSGLSGVEVKLSSQVGSGWSTVVDWADANNDVTGQGDITTTWDYTIGISLIDGTTYQAISRAEDKTGNYDVVLSTVVFYYDGTPPETFVAIPDESVLYYNSLASITGTATDGFTGVDKVYVRIENDTENSYWSHTLDTWIGNSTWTVATGVYPWDYTTVCSSLTDASRYKINSRGGDFAGNLSEWTTTTFVYDTAEPNAELWKPDEDYHYYLPTISGTAWEEYAGTGKERSKLDKVEVAIQKDPPNGDWWKQSAKDCLYTNGEVLGDPDLPYFSVSGVTSNSDYADGGGWYVAE
jgi:hypothetical protein